MCETWAKSRLKYRVSPINPSINLEYFRSLSTFTLSNPTQDLRQSMLSRMLRSFAFQNSLEQEIRPDSYENLSGRTPVADPNILKEGRGRLRQFISSVLIYRKCAQRNIILLHGKSGFLKKNKPMGGGAAAPTASLESATDKHRWNEGLVTKRSTIGGCR